MAMLTKGGLTVGPPGLEDVVERLVRHYEPSSVILFGSYAWGTPGEDSDVDLFVVKDDPKPRIERIWEATGPLYESGGVPFPMDLLVYTPAEIEQRLGIGDWFVEDIVRKGITLYEAGHAGVAGRR
jgi:predicted nucleotidyltransferase